jgi:hypothetical protein
MWFYWSTLTINNSIIRPLLECHYAAQYGLISGLFIASIKRQASKYINDILIFSDTLENLANHFRVRSQPGGGPIKFAQSVHPSVRTKQRKNPWMDFHESWYFGFLMKFIYTFKFLLKSAEENNGYFYVTTYASFYEYLECKSPCIYRKEKHFKRKL